MFKKILTKIKCFLGFHSYYEADSSYWYVKYRCKDCGHEDFDLK